MLAAEIIDENHVPPQPALNQGFNYQCELESHLTSLKIVPESDHYLDALLQSVVEFHEALKEGAAVVLNEYIGNRVADRYSGWFVQGGIRVREGHLLCKEYGRFEQGKQFFSGHGFSIKKALKLITSV